MIDPARFWTTMIILGALTYGMRVSFMILMRRREPPARLMKALRFVPATVLPALIAPQVVFPAAEHGAASPLRMAAAGAALAVGALTRNMLATIAAGAAVFWIGRAFL